MLKNNGRLPHRMVRDVVVSSNENITVLKQHLTTDEHKDQTIDNKMKKNFMLKLLTDSQWSKNAFQDTLQK